MQVLTATPPAADALATRQNKTSAALIANRLLRGLPTVRSLPSRRATHQPPSIDSVRQIHARARRKRAGPRELSPPSQTGWTFLELRPQPEAVGSFWKVSSQSSSGYGFYLFEHYSSVGGWSYEGPSYVYVVLKEQPTCLGFVCGGQLITT
jgi:hypothetical protein